MNKTIEHLKKLKSFHNGSYGADIDEAIEAIEQLNEATEQLNEATEQLGCLTDRPCDVCRFKTKDGCYRYECVFKGV